MNENFAQGIVPIYAVFTTKSSHPLSLCEAASKVVPDGRFAIEDMNFVDEKSIERIIPLKPLYCGLTWNYDNSLAGGADGKCGLTQKGKNILRRLDENDICIDTAHLNRKSFWQVMETDPKKVICSHTALDFVNSHSRNLTKEQIYAILLCGGIIGICFVSEFLCASGQATIDDLCDHILAFLNTFGDEGLALGSDFYGTSHGVSGLNGYRDLILLETALHRRGLDVETIDKIFYFNANKFWST